MKHPDRAECLNYLIEYGTPEHVIGHCKSVAAVAWTLGNAINKAGGTMSPEFRNVRFASKTTSGGRIRYYQDQDRTLTSEDNTRMFDLDLVLSAGLLHDMARVEERHWDVCADFCHEKGLFEEEHIIRIHMQYEYTNDAFNLTEADLVSLGDRLSLEDRYAGLDRRMEYIIKKAERNGNPGAREKIMRKKAETKLLLESIEKRIGMSIDELMADIDYENVEKGICE